MASLTCFIVDSNLLTPAAHWPLPVGRCPLRSVLAQLLRPGTPTRVVPGTQPSSEGVSASCLGQRPFLGSWSLAPGCSVPPFCVPGSPSSAPSSSACSLNKGKRTTGSQGPVRPESSSPSPHFKEGPTQLGTCVFQARSPVSWLTLLYTNMLAFSPGWGGSVGGSSVP